jgi:protein-S-isoprenylcysteine O-methyltransferase Ste14
VEKKISLLKLLIQIIKFLIPVSVIIMKILNPHVKNGWLFVGYVIFVALERTFETFYSGKFEKHLQRLEKDWAFQAVALVYTTMAFIMIFEYFLVPRNFDVFLVTLGGILFFIALGLRLWGVKTLGESWQTKILPRKLITDKGPYKFMRHPIYIGVIIEAIAVSMIPGTYYAFLFAVFVFVPLMIVKAYMEEKDLLKIYGDAYKDYIKKRWAFIPLPKFLLQDNKVDV